MFMLGLPLRASVATFGLAGIGIVYLEAWGLHQRESVSWPQAFRKSIWINLFSTLMGFELTWGYAAGGLLFLMLINIGLLTLFLSQLLLRLLAARRGSPQLLLMKVLTYVISFVVSFVVSFAIFMIGANLNFGIGIKSRFMFEPESFTFSTYITATLGLLALNFLLTWILESYLLTRQWKEKSPAKLCRTVFWINVRSYVYILLPIVVLGGLLQSELY
uniref:Uncharacterized protein n=1 Tax=Cyanothece sp. (strain PCC 7425 / ATCC 29141) TaxID=395961 RepID=B8HT48_CYAP4